MPDPTPTKPAPGQYVQESEFLPDPQAAPAEEVPDATDPAPAG